MRNKNQPTKTYHSNLHISPYINKLGISLTLGMPFLIRLKYSYIYHPNPIPI